jgi:hypothetical protein
MQRCEKEVITSKYGLADRPHKRKANAIFVRYIELHGLLPIPEVCKRYRAGEITWQFFVPALLGRLAQDQADLLDDDDPKRDRLLSVAFRAEDWFEVRIRGAKCSATPVGERQCNF